MRILIVRDSASAYPVKNSTYNLQEVGLAMAFSRLGHTCDILNWTASSDHDLSIPADSTDIHVLYRQGKKFLKDAVYPDDKDLFSSYDILMPEEEYRIESGKLARTYPDKTVIYHGPYYAAMNKRYNRYARMVDPFLLPIYQKNRTPFITKSKRAQDYLADKGISREMITTIGVGLNPEMLEKGSEKDVPSFIQRMKYDPSSFKCLYIGKWEPRRNTLFLIDVFRAVVDVIPDASLYMIGEGSSEYEQMVNERIREYGLNQRVRHSGKIPQKYLARAYEAADVFLLPSSYEIFGMVLLEAMYFHKPVLTTSNGGSDTLIQDGVNGLIRELDLTQWSQAVLSLSDRVKRNKMGEKAGETIRNGYTWDILAPQFIQVYERLRTEHGKSL